MAIALSPHRRSGQAGPILQPKLTVNGTGDKYEKEANRVADAVMRMPEQKEGVQTKEQLSANRIQRICPRCRERHRQGEPLNCRKCGAELWRSTEDIDVSASRNEISQAAAVASRPGTPLAGDMRSFFESRMGKDFRDVRIHTGVEADRAARSVVAQAFTIGSDIVFRSGEYRPGTREGRRLLAHELTHVIQQGAAPPLQTPAPAQKTSTSSPRAGRTVVQRTPQEVIQRQFTARCTRHLAQTRTGSVCEAPPSARRVGTAVHSHLQKLFKRGGGRNRYTEVMVPYGGKAPCGVFDPSEPVGSIGRIDLVQVTKRTASNVTIKIGEIKPLNVEGLAAGVHDIHNCYADKVRDAGANCVAPTDPLDFAFCAALGAVGKTVTLDSKVGVRWSPGNFSLTLGRPRRMAGTRCTDGVIGYRCLGDDDKKKKKKKGGKRNTQKNIKKGAKKSTKKTLKKGAKKLAKKLIPGKGYVDAAIVALALLGGAKPSFGMDGMEPEEALFEILTKGAPPEVEISEELQALLSDDPALQERLRELAEKQEQPSREDAEAMIKLLEAHKDQLDQETLQALASVMEAGSKSGKVPKSEEFRKTLDAIKQGAQLVAGEDDEKTAGEGGESIKAEDGTAKGAEPGQGTAEGGDEESDLPPGIDPATKKRLQEAPANVRKLYEGLITRTKVGPKVTTEFVQRFLNLVPPELTDEQFNALLGHIVPASDITTIDDILNKLQQAVADVKAANPQDDTPAQDDQQPSADVDIKPEETPEQTPDPGKEPPAAGSTRKGAPADLQKTLEQLTKQLDDFKGWDRVSPNSDTARGRWTQREDGSKRTKGDLIPIKVYGRLQDGVRFVTRATVEFKKLEKGKITYIFRSVTVILFENGRYVSPPADLIGKENTTPLD